MAGNHAHDVSGAAHPRLPRLWRDPFFWLTLLLTAFAVAPFALPGYFWGANDARHHVYFLFEYDRVVQDGIWWPRWSPDFAFGYGYPFFNIYGPFSHFLAELLHHFLGLSFTAAVESVFALSIVGSAGAMYGFVRSWAGRSAGLIAGLVYTYAPYHLLNLYVRANLAESMAFVWLPLILWAAREAIVRPNRAQAAALSDAEHAAERRPTRRRALPVIGLALSYAGLMYTSNLVTVLFTPLLAGYVLLLTLVYAIPEWIPRGALSWGRRFWLWLNCLYPPVLGGLAGLGLSAAFWMPAFLERNSVRVDQWFAGRYDFRGHFVYLFQLFSPRWGFGVSTPGPSDPIGYQLGAVALIFAGLGVALIWRFAGRRRWEVAFLVLAAIAGASLSLRFAAPLWEMPIVGGILQSAQFPWRWLVIPTVAISALAGTLGAAAEDRISLPAIVLAALVILGSYPYLQVQITEPVEGPVSLAGLMRFQQSSDEMTGSTAWVKEIPQWSPMADYYISQDNAGEPVKPIETKLDYTRFDYKTLGAESVAHNTVSEEIYFFNGLDEPQTIVFNHFYYPGWNAYLLAGKHGPRIESIPITPEPTGALGRMTVQAPPGEGYLLLVYEDTPPRTIGGIITLTTAGILIATALIDGWRARRARAKVAHTVSNSV